MPRVKKESSVKQMRHDPLEKQIRDSQQSGTLKAPKAVEQSVDDEEMKNEFVSDRLSKKILEVARQQQQEIDEDSTSAATVAKSVASSRSALAQMSARGLKKPLGGRNEDDDDEDEDLNDLEDEDYSDVEEVELDEADERVLSQFMPSGVSTQRTLADLIMEKIREKEESGAMDSAAAVDASADGTQEMVARQLDPKVVAVYTQVGQVLSKWTSGKIPKAFKIIPSLKNWEEVLFLTNPGSWTPNAMSAATILFASNMNPKLAQRFFNLVLLPAVRDDIARNKRLNFHYFLALKKSVFKPAAFFKGVLLPLVQDGCTAREAVVLSSLLAKVSLPVEHAGVAILKLCQLKYNGTSSLFLKTLLNKKYSLPLTVVAEVVSYLMSFLEETRTLPVVWHQTFLVFAQRYKTSLTDAQRESLKTLLRRQSHHQISPEIRRELFGAKHGDAGAAGAMDDQAEMRLE